ncbi:hypothetical protein [Escherichia coli]|nr:hypothetical protein [Escherichia coli]
MSGDLPSHQSIGTMDLCYSKTWPDKQVVLRLVLWLNHRSQGGCCCG